MTPNELWPMIVTVGGIVFGAGQLVAKIRNGKYVTKEVCALQVNVEKEHWQDLKLDLKEIKDGIGELRKTAHTHPEGSNGHHPAAHS